MQWLNSLVSEYEGRPLQKTGMLTKEQLVKFFQDSSKQFNNPEFKQLLSVSLKARGRGGPEEAVNGMQREIFQSMGVQGDFGLNCLSRVNQVYADDAFFLRQFYEHVQKEEMVLDEAEMPEALFKSKYEQLSRFRGEMEARMAKLKDMTPEQQAAFMSEVYKEMIQQSTSDAAECCNHPQSCSHSAAAAGAGGQQQQQQQPMAAPGAALPPTAGLLVAAAGAAAPAAGPGGSSAMSEAEQLAFFSSLAGGPGGK